MLTELEPTGISPNELAKILWKGKWLLLAGLVAFSTVSGVISIFIPTEYEANVVVAPVSSRSSTGGLGSLVSQFGGLAALAGVAVNGDSEKAEKIAVLQSEALTEQYIRDNNLLPILFAKDWDQARSSWKLDNEKIAPSLWRANAFFKKNVRTVSEDRKSGLVTLTIKWSDPKVAARWANDLVSIANEYLRQKAIAESQSHVAFLKAEALKTDIVQLRDAIYSVLESEIKNEMLARGTAEYAFRVIDPAVPPELPSAPKRLLWTVVGGVAGLFLSVLLLLMIRTRPEQKPGE